MREYAIKSLSVILFGTKTKSYRLKKIISLIKLTRRGPEVRITDFPQTWHILGFPQISNLKLGITKYMDTIKC